MASSSLAGTAPPAAAGFGAVAVAATRLASPLALRPESERKKQKQFQRPGGKKKSNLCQIEACVRRGRSRKHSSRARSPWSRKLASTLNQSNSKRLKLPHLPAAEEGTLLPSSSSTSSLLPSLDNASRSCRPKSDGKGRAGTVTQSVKQSWFDSYCQLITGEVNVGSKSCSLYSGESEGLADGSPNCCLEPSAAAVTSEPIPAAFPPEGLTARASEHTARLEQTIISDRI